MLEINTQVLRSFAETFDKSENPQEVQEIIANVRRVKFPTLLSCLHLLRNVRQL